MKILFFQDDFPPKSFGGAGIIAFNLAKVFHKMGHVILVITTVQDRKMEGLVEYEGLKIHRIYSNYHDRWRAYISLYNPQTVKKVQGIIEEFKPEIVHAHNIHSHLSYHCFKIAKRNRAKVFLTAHDVMLFHYGKLVEFANPDDLLCHEKYNYKVTPWQQIKRFKKRYNPFRNLIIKHHLKYVDKIFAVSDTLKDVLNQNGIENVEVIHNGINLDDWVIDNLAIEKFKNKYNLHDKKVVLFGGRLSAAKGGNQAILAMKKVIEKFPKAVLLVIGEKNTYAEEMVKISDDLGIKKNLVFTGWISGDELKAAYHTSDVVCVLSLYPDPFPTVNLEAMACKKPVIGTCLGGTPEIISDGVSGYVINPFDINNLTKKIVEILFNIHLSREMGATGYKIIQESFSLKKQAKSTLSCYTC